MSIRHQLAIVFAGLNNHLGYKCTCASHCTATPQKTDQIVHIMTDGHTSTISPEQLSIKQKMQYEKIKVTHDRIASNVDFA